MKMKTLIALAVSVRVFFFAGGTAFSAPVVFKDSATAAQASFWLRKQLNFKSSPDEVVSALFPYNILRILNQQTKVTIHDNGMISFYSDPVLVNDVLNNQLKPVLADHAGLMKAGCLYYGRSFSMEGSWEVIEPEKGKFHFEIPQVILNSAAAGGGEDLMVIVPFSSWDQGVPGFGTDTTIPTFAGGASPKPPLGPVKNPVDFADFCKNVKLMFPNQKIFEIANEMEFPDQAPYYKKGTEYAALVNTSRNNLPAGSKILNGGAIGILAPEANQFWVDFFDAGGGNDIDVLNIHYPNEVNYGEPEKSQRDPTFKGLESLLDFFNDLMENEIQKGNLAGMKPIWITEFCVGIGHPQITEREVAEWYVKKFSFAAARNVKKVFVEFGGKIPGTPPLFFETAPFTYEVTLSFYTQKLMNHKLTGFTECTELARAEQYRFRVGAKNVYVFWGDKLAPSELQAKKVKITDIFGNETITVIPANTAVNKLPGGNPDRPVFIELY
jgi:hypothetical protein